MVQDYSSNPRRKSIGMYHLSISALLFLATILIVYLFSQPERAQANVPQFPQNTVDVLPLNLPNKVVPDTSVKNDVNSLKAKHYQSYTIKSGDTLHHYFQMLSLSPSTLAEILKADKQEGGHLNNILPGQILNFLITDKQLEEMVYISSSSQKIYYTSSGSSFSVDIHDQEIESRIDHIQASIEDSLFSAGIKAGMSEKLIMELVSIFGWDIDFALDIRKGDRFNLIYERLYLDGKYIKDGNILAATFTNQNRNHTAIMFRDDDGRRHYYTPEGRSLKKAFLRSPIDFRRISSTFQKERYHPVYGKKKPHKGVDYAAKTGTSIKAAGDGTVIFKGRKGGYGRTVIIQHGHNYQTLYAHMSRYHSRVKQGTKVKQGQIIGYVGRSGVATGPHLHYEFRVNGHHKNPLSVKLPDSSPIDRRYRHAFNQQAQQLLGLLELSLDAKLALNL